MIIEFKNIETQKLPNFKGGEKEYEVKMFDAPKARIMQGILRKGASIGFHKHETNSETMFFTAGVGRLILEEGEKIVNAGDCHYCPKGSSHSLINDNDEPLMFYAVVAEQ